MIQQRLAAIFAGLTFRLVLIGIIALLLVNTYADISFKGPLGIGVHFEGWAPRARRFELAVKGEQNKHRVTLASLSQLEQRLAAFVKEGEQRTRAAQEALRAQERRSAALGEQIARIRAQRPSAGEIQRCETPSAVRQASGL